MQPPDSCFRIVGNPSGLPFACARLADYHYGCAGPAFGIVAVDKSSRHLFLLARRSPLTVEEAFPSIHGRIEGDKQVEGDLRTPEGVYFVRGKIQAPLDFDEYGSQAHALNYPNPVDRLRGNRVWNLDSQQGTPNSQSEDAGLYCHRSGRHRSSCAPPQAGNPGIGSPARGRPGASGFVRSYCAAE